MPAIRVLTNPAEGFRPLKPNNVSNIWGDAIQQSSYNQIKSSSLPPPTIETLVRLTSGRLREEDVMTTLEKLIEPLRHSPFLPLLDTFAKLSSIGEVKVEKCLCVFPRNDYAPDIVFFCSEKAATLTTETVKFPTPDLITDDESLLGANQEYHRQRV